MSVAGSDVLIARVVGAQSPGVVSQVAALRAAFSGLGLSVISVTDVVDDARWLRLAPMSRERATRGMANLRHTHRIECHAIRAI